MIQRYRLKDGFVERLTLRYVYADVDGKKLRSKTRVWTVCHDVEPVWQFEFANGTMREDGFFIPSDDVIVQFNGDGDENWRHPMRHIVSFALDTPEGDGR